MERRLGSHVGGIRGLLSFLREHREAVEYDLIALGLRLDWLGTDELSYRDVWIVITQAPVDSAVSRSILGDEHPWGLTQQLLADAADNLRFLAWAKTKDAEKGINAPEPIMRPGVKDRTQQIKGRPSTREEIDEWIRSRGIRASGVNDG